MVKRMKKQTKKSVRPGKDLVDSNAESLNKKLYKVIEQGITELSLDFKNVKTIDPVGLSVIAATYNTMNNAGSKLLLKNVPDEINTLFNELGLNKYFIIGQMNQNQNA
jgi:anti-anti-sigma factor